MDEFLRLYEWDEGTTIGKGMFAKVYSGRMRRAPAEGKISAPNIAPNAGDVSREESKESSRLVAVKKITTNTVTHKQMAWQELKIREAVGRSEYIVDLYHCAPIRVGATRIMSGMLTAEELIGGGDLFDLVSTWKFPLMGTTNDRLLIIGRILGHVLRGLKFLHERNYMHGDVKLENVLIQYQGATPSRPTIEDLANATFKLGDLGLSRKTDKPSVHLQGSYVYSSYQALSLSLNPRSGNFECLPYSAPADIWAVGMLAFVLWHGKYLFDQPDIKKICEELKSDGLSRNDFATLMDSIAKILRHLISSGRLSGMMRGFPGAVRDFILGCLVIEEAGRATAEQLLQLPLITAAIGSPLAEEGCAAAQ